MNRRCRTTFGKAGLILLAAVLVAGFAPAKEKKDSPAVTALRSLKLGGYTQLFGAVWDRSVDTFSLRRARLSLGGEIAKNLRFKIQADLVKSPALLDAVVEFTPSKAAGLRAGQFLVPFSLESVTSTSDIDMINRSIAVGVNWHIVGKTKLQLNYEIHRLEAGWRERSGLLAQFQAAF